MLSESCKESDFWTAFLQLVLKDLVVGPCHYSTYVDDKEWKNELGRQSENVP